MPFDHGVRLIDQNGFRMGPFASCLLPLFRAADVVAEEHTDVSVDWSSVDVVTDRNNLRKLLRWLQNPEVPANNGAVAGSSDPSKEAGLSFVAAREAALRDFRIDFQLGGRKTVLLHRWEKRTRELAQPPRSGCGLNFEQESTRPAKGCLRSTGHHRIVTYVSIQPACYGDRDSHVYHTCHTQDMGGLKLVVRCEVDACLPQPEATTSRAANGTTTLALSEPKTANDDNLANMMSELDVSSPSSPEDPPSESITDINVIRAGTIVPQSDTIEVTTRSVRYIDEFDWTEQYPQLFLSYTPNIFLAVHDRGTFERMIQRKLGTSELRAVEQSPRIQRAFRQLVAVLREIQALATSFGKDARLSLVCRDGKLEVFKRTNGEGSLEEAELERFDA